LFLNRTLNYGLQNIYLLWQEIAFRLTTSRSESRVAGTVISWGRLLSFLAQSETVRLNASSAAEVACVGAVGFACEYRLALTTNARR